MFLLFKRDFNRTTQYFCSTFFSIQMSTIQFHFNFISFLIKHAQHFAKKNNYRINYVWFWIEIFYTRGGRNFSNNFLSRSLVSKWKLMLWGRQKKKCWINYHFTKILWIAFLIIIIPFFASSFSPLKVLLMDFSSSIRSLKSHHW